MFFIVFLFFFFFFFFSSRRRHTRCGRDWSSDVCSSDLNLVSMLFDFIFDDQALATEIKALIGRLQIPFLKTAIADKSFFSNEQHPARLFLNALARAGSQWSKSQGVSDPLYRLIRESVFKMLNDFDLDASLFERLRA